jgi:hypothetical protein
MLIVRIVWLLRKKYWINIREISLLSGFSIVLLSIALVKLSQPLLELKRSLVSNKGAPESLSTNTPSGVFEIVTELKPLDKFWQAEDYHQNYLTKNPNGYCPNHKTRVKFANIGIHL